MNAIFNYSANTELVALINRLADRRNTSGVDLPVTDIAPTSADLQRYKNLDYLHLSTPHLQLRAMVLQAFNRLVSRVLPLADLSLPAGFSTLTDGVRAARDSVFWSTKKDLWERALESTCKSTNRRTLDFDVIAAQEVFNTRKTDHKARRTIFGQRTRTPVPLPWPCRL
jgi:hypothetical protein